MTPPLTGQAKQTWDFFEGYKERLQNQDDQEWLAEVERANDCEVDNANS